jgi:hypothetical protein
MRDRFMLVRFVTALAIGAMVSFVGVGCGDDDNQQVDAAAQKDAPVQDDVAAQNDGQKDTAVQADAANTSGNVIIVQASPQLTGTAMDSQIGWIKASYVLAGWDAVDNDPDVPTSVLDMRTGPFGCYAKYYKVGQTLDGGAVSDYKPTTANAGDITVGGYTPGAFFVLDPATGGPQITDAGAPQVEAFPTSINCKRTEIEDENDAGVIPDAGTGRFTYTCDNESSQGKIYVTSFMAAADSLHVQAAGFMPEIAPFDATAVGVAPFIKVMPNGTLWNLPGVAAGYGTDAGIPLGYACGSTDAGVDTAPCAAALAIQIAWGDVDTAATSLEATPPYRHERGKIQCSKVGAGNQFNIPWEIWNAAFPAGSNWRTITTFITHITVVPEHNMTTVVGAGGGQVGVTHHP